MTLRPNTDAAARDLVESAHDRSFTVRSSPGRGASGLLLSRASRLVALGERPERIVIVVPTETVAQRLQHDTTCPVLPESVFIERLHQHLLRFAIEIAETSVTEVLGREEEARDKLHQRYRRILTLRPSEQMVQILDALTNGGEGGSVVVVEGPLDESSKRTWPVIGEQLDLAINTRSEPDVVGVLNQLAPVDQAATARRRPRPDHQTAAAKIDAGQAPGDEAAAVADLVADLVGDPAWTVRRWGWWEAAVHDDVAVVLPDASAFLPLAIACAEAGIEVAPVGDELMAKTDEAKTLTNVCVAVADPGQAIAVCATLRSDIFACNDADLVEWKEADGTWDPFAPYPPGLATHPVAVAFDQLQQWHDRFATAAPTTASGAATGLAPLVGAGPLVDAVMEFAHLRLQALVRPLSAGRLARYRYLRERAWGNAGQPVPEGLGIRVLTVHEAAGAAFPIVVVAGAHSTASETSADDLLAAATLAKDRLFLCATDLSDSQTLPSESPRCWGEIVATLDLDILGVHAQRQRRKAEPRQLQLPTTDLGQRLATWNAEQQAIGMRSGPGTVN